MQSKNVKSPSEGLSTYKGCSFVDLLARSSFRAAFYFNREFVQSTSFANNKTLPFFQYINGKQTFLTLDPALSKCLNDFGFSPLLGRRVIWKFLDLHWLKNCLKI